MEPTARLAEGRETHGELIPVSALKPLTRGAQLEIPPITKGTQGELKHMMPPLAETSSCSRSPSSGRIGLPLIVLKAFNEPSGD